MLAWVTEGTMTGVTGTVIMEITEGVGGGAGTGTGDMIVVEGDGTTVLG